MEYFDAILIPGGGLEQSGRLHPWTQARIDYALDLDQPHMFYMLLSGGTVHKPPPVDDNGFPLYESHVAADYLLQKGIPHDQILTEISSYDTIGNAYFSRVIHTQPRSLKNLLIITSQFHLERVKRIFTWIYDLLPLPHSFHLSFASAPNRGLRGDLLQARIKKEENSIKSLQPLTERIQTLAEFHSWFYTEHEAYTAGLSPTQLEGEIKNSY
ncbi:MAG: YdcF family protein [Anaerolineales bacterium]